MMIKKAHANLLTANFASLQFVYASKTNLDDLNRFQLSAAVAILLPIFAAVIRLCTSFENKICLIEHK